MKRASEIDYSKLLGFGAIGDDIVVGDIDFQDETIAAKFGAKVGNDPMQDPPGASKE